MDYETKATNRKELRMLASFFRMLCGLAPDEPVDPVYLLELLPSIEGFHIHYYDEHFNRTPADYLDRSTFEKYEQYMKGRTWYD